MSNEVEDFMEYALKQGWIEPIEGGYRIHKGNPVWDAHMESVDDTLSDMLLLGHVEVSHLNEQGQFVYTLTAKGEEAHKSG